jgi:4-diphosphocytidyl-2-C-methyl-D-erythritol kinase
MIRNASTLAHAKVNLHLAVGRPREDGYHPIQSIFARAALADTLSIEIEEGPFSVTVTGLEQYSSFGEDTVSRAARLWYEVTGCSLTISARVEKRIPVKSGLGGGSSDGAAMLRLLQQVSAVDEHTLFELACELGSDVPFFLSGHNAAIVEGRGEQITALPAKKLAVLLVMPRAFDVSTSAAYARLDQIRRGKTLKSFEDHQKIATFYNKSCPTWSGMMYNDFWLTVADDPFYRQISDLAQGGEGYAMISGSGACWYFVSERRASVEAMNQLVRRHVGDRVACWMTHLLG